MKKIFYTVVPVAVAIVTWLALSGFADNSTTEAMLRKRIADLEKQIAGLEKQAPACDYQYFDSDTDLKKFIATNYNTGTFNYSTMAANSTSLIKSLSSFPANSTVYISIIYDSKGKNLRISNPDIICNPLNICCPPNCSPPIPPKSIALPQSFNPYAKY